MKNEKFLSATLGGFNTQYEIIRHRDGTGTVRCPIVSYDCQVELESVSLNPKQLSVVQRFFNFGCHVCDCTGFNDTGVYVVDVINGNVDANSIDVDSMTPVSAW